MTSTPPDPSPVREQPALGELGTTEPPEDATPEPGEVIGGKYRVERVLGKGGMGVVVSATHLVLGQLVAIKMLRARVARQPEHVRRFLREARAASRLTSEHVARVVDVGTLDGGTPFMVLEHLVGADLGALLDKRGKLPVPTAVDYVLQACQAVAEAHALGLVHRDIKPSNLFLTKRSDGSPLVKVLDFGIAKAMGTGAGAEVALTSTGAAMGSPRYMSPEQVRNAKDVDARADVWALGVVLHELCAGSPPFDADSVPALCAMIVADPPTRLSDVLPDAPPGLERVVLDCLAKDRRKRIADVATLVARLAPLATDVARSQASAESVRRVLSGSAVTRDALVASAMTPGDPVRALPSTRQNGSTRSDSATSGTAAEPAAASPAAPGGRKHGSGVVPDRRSETDATWHSNRTAPPQRLRWVAVAGAVVALAGAWLGWSRARPASAPQPSSLASELAAPPTGPIVAPAVSTSERDGATVVVPSSTGSTRIDPSSAEPASSERGAAPAPSASTKPPPRARPTASAPAAPTVAATATAAPPQPPKAPAVDPMGDRK